MKLLFPLLLLSFLVACSGGMVKTTPTVVPLGPSPESPIVRASPEPSLAVLVTPAVSPTPVANSPTASPVGETAQPQKPVVALPVASAFTWQLVVNGLNRPVGLANAADGSGRFFVIEQPGLIRIIQDGALLPTPFLDIRDRVGSRGSEQGLLGLAFHPGYKENGYFFVNYTDLNGNTVIARFQALSQDPNRSDPASETQLLHIPQPYPNHNGGAVVFGPDGYLYLGLGDGGSQGDPRGNGQSRNTFLGKILRIDVDHGSPYVIPADNPFAKIGGLPEIWAYGLRNPWRFSFDPLTKDLYIGDVGQDTWEEIDFLPAGSPGGANFGWSYLEGKHAYKGTPPGNLKFVLPVAEYSHQYGCSVTGGVVYRGKLLPAWQGVYLYGDYCTGNIWGLVRDAQGQWMNALLFEGVGQITSFGVNEAGEVFLTDYAGGIYQLLYTKG